MEKYLLPHPAPAPIISEQKKYRRDSASGIDQFFGDGDGLPYSINMNVFLPDVTHLRTGLYKQQRPTVTHIKTEPDAIFSQQNDTAPSQALPEFTSIFSSHQNTDVNSVFIKQELPSPELHLPMNTQQGQLYQLLSSPDMDIPNSAAQVAAMNTLNSVSMTATMAEFNNTLSLPTPQHSAMKQFQRTLCPGSSFSRRRRPPTFLPHPQFRAWQPG